MVTRLRLIRHAQVVAAGALACAAGVLGCSEDAGGGGGALKPGSPNFDAGVVPTPRDGGVSGEHDADPGDATEGAELRWVLGVPNLGAARVCHDPDFTPDNPATPEDETSDGPKGARALWPAPLGLGEVSDYVSRGPLRGGAISFHQAPTTPLDVDAGADAGAAEAGVGPVEAPPCDPGTRLFSFALPLAAADLGISATPGSLSDLGVTTRLDGEQRLTIYVSGLMHAASDRQAFFAAEQVAREAQGQPPAQAARGAADALGQVLARRGARILPHLPPPAPARGRVSLSLAHMIPDVPTTDEGTASGAVVACLTVDGVVHPAPYPRDAAGARFRLRTLLAQDLPSGVPYTVRLFARDALKAEGADCMDTARVPLAETTLGRDTVRADTAHTIVASGAVDPDTLCVPPQETALPWAACPGDGRDLRASLLLIDEGAVTP